MSRSSSVSSEHGNPGDPLHEAVSNDGPRSGLERALVQDESTGTREAEMERVEGFNPVRALSEVDTSQEVKITRELEALPIAGLAEFGPETVCGNDDRVQISPATAPPWSWICQLLITLGNGSMARGTGWLIGGRAVMTSGHCLFGHATGGWARQIEVIPGMDGASRPFGSQFGATFFSTVGWVRDANQEFDYGAIILPDRTFSSRLGSFGFASLPDSDLQNLLVNNSGYPGDKPFGTQWFNAGTINTVRPRMFEYMIDTFGGQSGSPIWRLLSGQRHAVGVHGYGGCPNKAVRITPDVFNNMVTWRNL